MICSFFFALFLNPYIKCCDLKHNGLLSPGYRVPGVDSGCSCSQTVGGAIRPSSAAVQSIVLWRPVRRRHTGSLWTHSGPVLKPQYMTVMCIYRCGWISYLLLLLLLLLLIWIMSYVCSTNAETYMVSAICLTHDTVDLKVRRTHSPWFRWARWRGYPCTFIHPACSLQIQNWGAQSISYSLYVKYKKSKTLSDHWPFLWKHIALFFSLADSCENA